MYQVASICSICSLYHILYPKKFTQDRQEINMFDYEPLAYIPNIPTWEENGGIFDRSNLID
jgi:hypothetical protein